MGAADGACDGAGSCARGRGGASEADVLSAARAILRLLCATGGGAHVTAALDGLKQRVTGGHPLEAAANALAEGLPQDLPRQVDVRPPVG